MIICASIWENCPLKNKSQKFHHILILDMNLDIGVLDVAHVGIARVGLLVLLGIHGFVEKHGRRGAKRRRVTSTASYV